MSSSTDDDALNNETFGDLGVVGNDFDFGNQPMINNHHHQHQQPIPPPVMSLEEVEAQLFSHLKLSSQNPTTTPHPNTGDINQQSKENGNINEQTGDEGEESVQDTGKFSGAHQEKKKIIFSNSRQYHNRRHGDQTQRNNNNNGYYQDRFHNGNNHQYNNRNRSYYQNQNQQQPLQFYIMTEREKEAIAKIQVSQLVTDRPEADDFYFYIWSKMQSGQMESSKGNVTDKIRNQMQKLIDNRNKRTKGTTLSLEGSLGKVAIKSSKTPRQAIQVNITKSEVPEKLSKVVILRGIEKVYTHILKLEEVERIDTDALNEDGLVKREKELSEELAALWKAFECDSHVSFSAPHPMPSFLLYAKGKKSVPRAIKFLDMEQKMIFFSTLLNRIECVDVIHVSLGTPNEEVELFMNQVIPSLVSYISSVPLAVINQLMRTILERHNMIWFTSSKVGLAILTMLLSRAEIVKSGGMMGFPMTEGDLNVWSDLYAFLFQSLQSKFNTLFPKTVDPLQNTLSEVYTWQFLAAMAVGASTIDYQRILVTELREKVIDTAKRQDPKGLANVDLFLNALGLNIDAQQLASMKL